MVLLATAIVGVGVFLRVTFLEADPTYPYWMGWVTDEGRWTGTARNVVLFEGVHVDSGLARIHLILSPLYQTVTALAFAVFGVAQGTARSVSAVSGLLAIGVVGAVLRGRARTRTVAIALALLAVQPDLVYFSRVAIPEALALALKTATFAILVVGPRTRSWSFAAGLCMAAALGAKGTVAPIVPFFGLIIWALRRPADLVGWGPRLGAFVAGIVVPGALFLTIALTGSSGGIGFGTLVGFIGLEDPYDFATTLIEGGWATRVNLMLVVLLGLSLVARMRGLPDRPVAGVFVASMIWAVGWIVAWATLDYFPERYVVHVYVPLVVALASGLELLESEAPRSLGEAFAGLTSWDRLVFGAVLALPGAALITPWFISLLAVSGVEFESLRFRLPLLAVLAVTLGAILLRRAAPRAVVGGALVFPSVSAGLWIFAEWVDLVPIRFWTLDPGQVLAPWTLILGVGVAGAVGYGRRAAPWSASAWVAGYALFLAVFWTAQGLARHQVRPEVRSEIVAVLEERYPDGAMIGSMGASGLLVGSGFRYREVEDIADRDYDALIFLEGAGPLDQLEDLEYIDLFHLEVGPDHDRPESIDPVVILFGN